MIRDIFVVFLFLVIAVEGQQVTVLRMLLVLLADSILHAIPISRVLMS